MTDLALGLQTALFAKLSVGVTLAPVGQHIEEDSPLPYVLIGEDVIEDIGGKGDRLESHTVTISTVYEGTGKKQMRRIQAQVYDCLADQPLVADGCNLSDPSFLSAEDALLEDGVTYVGQQRFLVFAQPAD